MGKMYMLGRKIFAAAAAGLAIIGSATAWADVPLNYYESLNGLKCRELKNAIHELVTTDVSMLSYGSGTSKTWGGFYVTDRNDDNTVIDRYSNIVREFGSQGSAISGMNIEHSFAKSWWGGSSNNAYKDLYNLMPCDASINSSKSNYVMGKVSNVTTDNGCTKIGSCDLGFKVWEPADKWKGDFARDYMYMATAYQNFTWETEGVRMLETGDYPTLQQWASDLFIEWAKDDPVDEIEIKRNNDVQSIQGNRNPYVDFPNLMEYVWGDSINVEFNIYTTVKSGVTTGDPSIPEPEPVTETLWFASFLGDGASCTVETEVNPDGVNVWYNTASYGWKGSGATTSNGVTTCHLTDSRLVTPVISMRSYEGGKMTFEHACKYATDPKEVLSVSVRDSEGVETLLDVPTWPKGTNWTFVESGEIDLSAFAGKDINIVFRYTSTADEASTWEIKNVTVTGQRRQLDGDVDGNGAVDIADISALIDIIVSGSQDSAGDIDGNGTIDISDISSLIDLML